MVGGIVGEEHYTFVGAKIFWGIHLFREKFPVLVFMNGRKCVWRPMGMRIGQSVAFKGIARVARDAMCGDNIKVGELSW